MECGNEALAEIFAKVQMGIENAAICRNSKKKIFITEVQLCQTHRK